jgi:quinol monooxygenase YgiN
MVEETMIVVTGSISAKAEGFEEARRLSLEHVRRSRGEPGCLSHSVHIDCENPLRLVFIEHWETMQALRTHFAVPASREFTRSLRPLADQLTIEVYDAAPVEVA